MRRLSVLTILAGATFAVAGCKTSESSKASSQIGQDAASARRPAITSDRKDALEAGPERTAASHAGMPLVVCFGDSLTAGLGASDGASYPDFLQKDLDADGYHYQVVNEGVSGNTTKDGLDRLAGVVAIKPALVVLEFGGNDGLRGMKVADTRANLATMIEALHKGGANIVLAGITLPPDYGADYVTSFTQNYPTLGKKYGVPVLPFLLKDVYGVPGMMQHDMTHATDKGNEVVARNVLPLVEGLLRK